MTARELLARATPRPWHWNADEWAIVGPGNEDAIVGGPEETLVFIAPNLELAITATNEYEALLQVEASLRASAFLLGGSYLGHARDSLDRLDAIRKGGSA